MTWVVPLALGGLAVLVMAVFTMLSARKHHHTMVQPAVQPAGPRILIHDINDDRCTGCDACVAVCPTNVLDLVANKSRVLRFQDCIQCEACMFACPTEALVMFPEGGTPPPLKVPEIDEHFQTAIPGQYLIGEVAGKPLVKNAANLGRVVVEHMLATGLHRGALGRSETVVDVAIIGSGPGGLSAALTCIQKGLSYVVLEKEQEIASTISRYPKGKLVMAEPYDTQNLSLLPVYDSSKEQLIAVWRELLDRIGVRVRKGESVETVQRGPDGAFDIRTTVGAYRAQRVVLSIGTRGKPRTLQVPGENLPKVRSLLEDPDEFSGRSVLVVGGGDSAVEAALALSDAGAQVIVSYRGKGFNRCAPKNKQSVEQYAAEGRIKAKLGSQVMGFEPDSVTLALGDGSQKRYPNDATFVLIGADPPVQWLEKMGVRFVERPHQHQTGKSDDLVRRFVANVFDCPEDAARAAAQVLGGSMGLPPMLQPPGYAQPQQQQAAPVSGPRKWLRSATSIFSGGKHTPPPAPSRSVQPTPATNQPVGMPGMPAAPPPQAAAKGKRLDQPMPLSEFAKRGRSEGGTGGGKFINSGTHSGHGRRDQLSAGERTRILRMLRDEGGRMADEDSQVFIGAAPAPRFDFDLDDDGPVNPPPPAPPMPRPDVPAKPAVVVGLAEAQASKSRSKRPTAAQQPNARRVPAPFGEEPTRQVNEQIVKELRNLPQAAPAAPPRPAAPPPAPAGRALVSPRKPSGRTVPPPFGQEPTRMVAYDPGELDQATQFDPRPEKFLEIAPKTEPGVGIGMADDLDNQATAFAPANPEAFANLDQPRQRRPPQQPSDERTRAVNIRNDQSMSDVDWDID